MLEGEDENQVCQEFTVYARTVKVKENGIQKV